MTVISWQKWADFIIDYGQQVYIPWALSEGQVLYRDIYYLYGPLSAYVHSLIFRILGPGILYLAIFNLILIALFSICVFRLIRHLSDSATATLATTAFLGGFAFAYHIGWGGMNFVCPYSYELTHGMMLGCLVLYQFVRYADQLSPTRIAGIGFLLGLVYLTKVEVFLATALALGTGWTVLAYFDRGTWKRNALNLGLFFISFLFPIFLFFLYFSFHMPATEALSAVIGPWTVVFNSEIRELAFYQNIRGTILWEDNLTKIALYTFVFAILISGLFYLNHYLARTGKNSARAAFYISAGVISLAIILHKYIPWLEIPRPFPLILAGYGIFKLVDWVKNRANPSRIIQNLPFFVFTLFAFLLTLKAILNFKFSHLGFVLALPATLAILIMLLYFLPRHVQKISGNVLIFRTALFSAASLVILVLIFNSHFHYMIKLFPVGKGVDRMYDFPPQARQSGKYLTRGIISQYILEYMDQHMEKDTTLSVFPDAIMFNYLTRHKTPTKDTLFNPLRWLLFGDVAVLDRLKKTPPPYVLFVDINYSWLGYRFFGKDYGKPIFEWVLSNYTLKEQVGPTPYTDQGFGVQIWELKENPK